MFLPLVYLLFYLVGDRARWCVLLAASLLFYATLNVPYLLVVLVLVTITTYGFGIWLDKADSPKAKCILLWSGIAANVLILVIMKYLPFLSENLKYLSTLISLKTQIQPVKALVSIGVSYYVLQAVSYLSDIYLEIEKPERHFGSFALYMAFFPKLLQGPIERSGYLLPQLKKPYVFSYDNMRSGMILFAWGLMKKVVIADRFALMVNPVYDNVHACNGVQLLLATYFFALQIYFDFSGYTDMALGTAKMFNINLTNNFNNPYFATSIADFWRRWHISFSRWILDYIFKPLQMQWRYWKNWGIAAALLVTFGVSGLWHGASWGYMVWGVLHGAYMAIAVFCKPIQKRILATLNVNHKSVTYKIFNIIVVFNLVCFAWIFFRSKSIQDSYYIIASIFRSFTNANAFVFGDFITYDYSLIHQSLLLCTTLAYAITVFVVESNGVGFAMNKLLAQNTLKRQSVYMILLLSLLFLGIVDNTKFLYLQY